MITFCSLPQALQELKKGKMLIVVDDPSRENQGDLIFPAETVTPQKVNFMVQNCRGMVCVPIARVRAMQLNLPLMVPPVFNTEKTKVPFTVTVDAKNVRSFGISAYDRYLTIKTLASRKSKPEDLVRPGHIFPLLADDYEVLARAGHTEATVTLTRLAGFSPCGVLCEILNDDGSVARMDSLIKFSQKFNLKIVTISDLIDYAKDKPVQKDFGNTIIKQASSWLPTLYGNFRLIVWKSIIDNHEHISLQMGKINREPTLVRIHSGCLTGDTLMSLKCDCREQLIQSMKMISQKGEGVIIYLDQEGRGIGLSNKIKAYALQEKGLDTVEANHALGFPADARSYQIAAEILHDLGISQIYLLTNNPVKIKQLDDFGIQVVKHIPIEVLPNKINRKYLSIKKEKLGHKLQLV